MKKLFIYLTILIIGGILGFLASNIINTAPSQSIETQIVKKVEEKVIIDTVIVKKKSPVVVLEDTTKAVELVSYEDSLYAEVYDETQSEEADNDFSEFISEEDTMMYDIISDELLSQRTVILTPPPIDSTDVEDLLDLKSYAFSQKMTIEFWKSPLNLTGYELSRNKLKLFGFNPTESLHLSLSQNGESLFLNTETMSILLIKSDNFQTLNLK